ncbi:hypothetical protein ACNOYE_36520 [Nannocystaceae bacterium ST9]
MATSARVHPRTGRALTLLALLAIVGASVWIRWPGFVQGGFASHDVAGILYNAMVLDRGGLPYVDTFEFKAPGSFYLASALAGPEARDIARLQIAANLFGLASLIALAALAWWMWGRVASVVAAGVLALHDAVLDSMDANYVTWANLPQILAFALAIVAGRIERPRLRPTLWLLAGAAAGGATLCKQPDGVVLAVIGLMALWPTPTQAWSGSWRERARRLGWSRAAWVLAGFVLIHVPIAAQYLGRGELGSLIDGYVLNRWTLRYLVAREAGMLDSSREGALALAHFLALPLVFAAFALAAPSSPEHRRERWFVALWLLATLFAASLGARFYKGYFVAVAPPLVLLAAAPWGLLGVRSRAMPWLRALALLALVPLLARQSLIVAAQRADRGMAHDAGGRMLAEFVAAHTEPDDTIWVWGWHLWDVYPLANRMSASPIYKSLGVLTPPNDDTWRRPASKQRFVDSEHAARLLADLERARPAYVLLGSTVPREQFRGLQALLKREYRLDRRIKVGRVQLWRRKDLGDR